MLHAAPHILHGGGWIVPTAGRVGPVVGDGAGRGGLGLISTAITWGLRELIVSMFHRNMTTKVLLRLIARDTGGKGAWEELANLGGAGAEKILHGVEQLRVLFRHVLLQIAFETEKKHDYKNMAK